MATKRQQTMAKVQREREVAQRRARKQQKKQEAAAARKATTTAQAGVPEGVNSVDFLDQRADRHGPGVQPEQDVAPSVESVLR